MARQGGKLDPHAHWSAGEKCVWALLLKVPGGVVVKAGGIKEGQVS